MPSTLGSGRKAIAALFFVSGACGLALELIASKMLALVLGSSMGAVTAVVTAFMGGLAMGSALAGRLGRGRKPLATYAFLEMTIGAYCMAFPALVKASGPVIVWAAGQLGPESTGLTVFRFVVAMALLALPTTLMGATLPVLTEALVESGRSVSRAVGSLYAANTLGAVTGALMTAYVLLSWMGMTHTLWLVATGDLGVALVALSMARAGSPGGAWAAGAAVSGDEVAAGQRGAGASRPQVSVAGAKGTGVVRRGDGRRSGGAVRPGDPSHETGEGVALALFLAGLAAMIYEIAWTRALIMVLGSSTYAFALILAAYIGGLSLGSWLFSRVADRTPRPRLLGAGLSMGVSLVALLTLPVLGQLPFLVVDLLIDLSKAWWLVQGAEALMVAAAIVGPTILMGGLFPLAARLWAAEGPGLTDRLGRLYAANTFGNILGSLLAGTLFVPVLGLERTVLLGSLLSAAAAITLLDDLPVPWSGKAMGACRAAMAAVPLAVFVLLPRWDHLFMACGPYMYAGIYANLAFHMGTDYRGAIANSGHLLFYKEGISATVAVREDPDGNRGLIVNGKTDASSYSDMKTQRLIGHLPALMHRSPRRCLLVGLGSGVTLASLLKHPVESVDVVEISPEVVQASAYFIQENDGALHDPRVHLIMGDGRAYLAQTDRRYDLICCEPTNPWIAGVGNLFTQEFWTSCRDHLAAGGVIAQWFQAYSMALDDFKSMVGTFMGVFPRATMWRSTRGTDYMSVAGGVGESIDLDLLRRRFELSSVKQDMEELGIDDPIDLLAHFVAGPRRLGRFTRGASTITDDSLTLELNAPRSLYADEGIARSAVEEVKEDVWAYVQDSSGAPIDRVAMSKLTSAREHTLYAIGMIRQGKLKEALREVREAKALAPADAGAAKVAKVVYMGVAQIMKNNGQEKEAVGWLEEIARRHPEDADLENEIGNMLAAQSAPADAQVHYQKALALEPQNVAAMKNLALALLTQGKSAEAMAAYQKALALSPHDPKIHNNLGLLYEKAHQMDRARQEFALASESDPADEQARVNLQGTFARYQ